MASIVCHLISVRESPANLSGIPQNHVLTKSAGRLVVLFEDARNERPADSPELVVPAEEGVAATSFT